MKVFCYGDSNTYGYDPVTCGRHPKDVRWTGVLQSMLGDDFEVLEQGLNSRTTVYALPGDEYKSGLYGLKVCLGTCRPLEIIVLMLGTNDLKEEYHASCEDIAAGVEKLVKEAREFLLEKQGFEPAVVLVSPIMLGEEIPDSYFGKSFKADAVERCKKLPVLYEALAFSLGCIYVKGSDYGWPSKEDCLHMMPPAHKALAEGIYPAVLKAAKDFASSKGLA